MKLRIYISFYALLVLFHQNAIGQLYGNEWIVPGQSYFRIPITQTGIYEISYSQINALGLSGIDPRRFQIFHHGVEQNILVLGESDGVFNTSDKIIFYAQAIDGTLDSALYEPYTSQPHRYYNLHGDVAYYFLTYNTSLSNKRMPVISATSSASPEAYHWDEKLYLFTDEYSRGREIYAGTHYSDGDVGEGWFGPAFTTQSTHILTADNLNTTSGQQPILEIMLVGRNNQAGRVVNILIGNPSSPAAVFPVNPFSYHSTVIFSQAINEGFFDASGNITVTIKANDVSSNNRISIAYIKLTYPQNLSMNDQPNKTITLAPSSSTRLIQMPWSLSGSPILFDIRNTNNISIIESTLTSGMLKAVIPESNSVPMKMYLSSSFIPASGIAAVDMTTPANFLTANYLIITHNKLMAAANEYAAYRSSVAGGSYNVMVMDVEKIYNLFSYGELTPLGIKKLCSYLADNNPNIQYVYIIGKGLDLLYSSQDPGSGQTYFYRKNPSVFINSPFPNFQLESFVPTYGSPASDLMFTMDAQYKPRIAIGRLFAANNNDVINYLNKVKEHELLDSNYLWRKHIIHLSGGKNLSEVNTFKSYMANFQNIAENSLFGGKVVKTYVKDLNNGTIDRADLADEVNKGVSYITFFGHASAYIIDIDIGFVSSDVEGYRNKGKYPLLIMNGCYTANSYFSKNTIAEDWINTPDRGALNVIGTTDLGFTGTLYNYTVTLYQQLFNTQLMLGKSVGSVQKNMLNVNSMERLSSTQMALHGDPAIKIYSPTKPDYEISGTKEQRADKPEHKAFIVADDGTKLTAATKSFRIRIPIKNFGAFNPEPIMTRVTRISNGKTIVYRDTIYSAVRYLDTVDFIIKGNNDFFSGLNKFIIEIDYNDSIPEMKEDNNVATIEYFIPLGAVRCLFPKEFSIVHKPQPITLVAQSSNLIIGNVDYYLEIDTSHKFDSPFKKTTIINAGPLVKWPNVAMATDNNTDSIVYYWRVRYNTIAPGEDTAWGTSSFVYIRDSPAGWSQSKYPQFLKDDIVNMNYNTLTKRWEFRSESKRVFARCYGNRSGTGPGNDIDSSLLNIGGDAILFPGYFYKRCNLSKYELLGNGQLGSTTYEIDGIVATAFTGSNFEHIYYPYPWWSCGRHPVNILKAFYGGSGIDNSVRDYAQSFLSNGDYYFFMANGNGQFSSWNNSVRDYLNSTFGATKIYDADDNEPYIFFGKKGATTPIAEAHSNDVNGFVEINVNIPINHTYGTITSTEIGPARRWGSFYKKVTDSTYGDEVYFKIIRINSAGVHVDTIGNFNFKPRPGNDLDSVDLAPLIDANLYPRIKLLAIFRDTLNLTPAQLKKWLVVYHKVPEGTMNPMVVGVDQYNIIKREEGADIKLTYNFENISDLSFDDSLKVEFLLVNSLKGSKREVLLIKADSLKPGQSVTFTYQYNTKGYWGDNQLRAFVNPYIQPEEYYNNNVIDISYEIIKDKTPPVIDVVFDGVHIMDGDIVSPSPVITITLVDNSKYLLLTNPEDLQIYMIYPGSKDLVTINHTNPDVLRYGQDPGADNRFIIEYQPKDLPDGIYSIVVQGRDVNGNKSGQLYRISFEVVNASTITNFYPYPNPFSTSTRFVFTLTGKHIPDDIKIQIMTVTGKVVREITKAELGHIHVGHNITDYAWDATDEFGDKLANGVYLYRVIIKDSNENAFNHRETAGDKSFKKNFGKLYILR